MSSVSRAEQQPDHHPLPPRPRSRRRRLRRARPRRPRARAACPTRSTSRSSQSRKPTRSRSSTSPSPPTGTRARDRRLRRAPRQGPPAEPPRRRPGAGLRRARYAMRIWLDPQRLAAFGLTPQDVEDALRRQNVEIPAGRIEGTHARVHRAVGDRPAHAGAVRRRDHPRRRRLPRCGCATSARSSSARATSASSRATTASTAVPLGIVKQAVANPLDISEAVSEVLPQIIARAAGGHEGRDRLRLDRSSSTSSIDEVYQHDRRGDPAGGRW